jgi:CheY-like chemotaxis protein
LKILLVDDDTLLAETTATLIQCTGNHQIYITDEPAEVFRQCQSGNVDIVIMDVNLPGAEWEGKSISGADLSRLLKTQPQTTNIPVILVTAYALVNEQQYLLKTSQADSFYAKPILDFDSFLEELNQLVKQYKI